MFTINFVLTTYKILLCIYIWHFIAFTLSWKKITRGRPANKTIIFVPLSLVPLLLIKMETTHKEKHEAFFCRNMAMMMNIYKQATNQRAV